MAIRKMKLTSSTWSGLDQVDSVGWDGWDLDGVVVDDCALWDFDGVVVDN